MNFMRVYQHNMPLGSRLRVFPMGEGRSRPIPQSGFKTQKLNGHVALSR